MYTEHIKYSVHFTTKLDWKVHSYKIIKIVKSNKYKDIKKRKKSNTVTSFLTNMVYYQNVAYGYSDNMLLLLPLQYLLNCERNYHLFFV